MSETGQIYTIDISGFLDAEGSAYEAGIENTITGVRWTLRGNLAKVVHLLIATGAAGAYSEPTVTYENGMARDPFHFGASPQQPGQGK